MKSNLTRAKLLNRDPSKNQELGVLRTAKIFAKSHSLIMNLMTKKNFKTIAKAMQINRKKVHRVFKLQCAYEKMITSIYPKKNSLDK